MDPLPPTRVAVRATRDPRGNAHAALVLQAMGVPHQIERQGAEYFLFVSSEDLPRAAAELEKYDEENANFPPRREELALLTNGALGAAVYAAILVLIFAFQRTDAFGHDWKELGLSAAQSVREGELWRPMTALTLHADAQHLLSNVIFGSFFGVLFTQLVGSGIGWFSIASAGFAGNLINALIHRETHRSLGASTAVFGALGLLVGYEIIRRRKVGQPFLRRWAPPLFGAVLLGMMGTGGDNTDVSAHATGFGSGAVLGVIVGFVDKRARLDRTTVQSVAVVSTLIAVALAWYAALR